MNRSLLNLLACPSCGGALRAGVAGSDPVGTGTLDCDQCGLRVPVRNGIPRFPAAADPAVAGVTKRTSRVYKFAWKKFGKPGYEGQWEKDSYKFASLIPAGLLAGEGRIGLDAGCGAGLDLVRMAEGGAQLVGLDLSEGVDVASELCAGFRNVDLVQADLNAPPFRPASFDFIYSFGVLHHLADTERGFHALSRLLKPGGSLVTYLYEDFGEHSGVERSLVGLVARIRQLTVRVPPGALYAGCLLGAPLVWASCSLPSRLLRPIAPRLAARIPFRHTLRWDVLASDLFDRMSPPVERRYSRSQVEDLYARAGLADVSVHWFRGWVSWGQKPISVAPPERSHVAV